MVGAHTIGCVPIGKVMDTAVVHSQSRQLCWPGAISNLECTSCMEKIHAVNLKATLVRRAGRRNCDEFSPIMDRRVMDFETDRVGILEGQDATVRVETDVALRRGAISSACRMNEHVSNNQVLDFDILRVDGTDSSG